MQSEQCCLGYHSDVWNISCSLIPLLMIVYLPYMIVITFRLTKAFFMSIGVEKDAFAIYLQISNTC